jgi:hypothetical protein
MIETLIVDFSSGPLLEEDGALEPPRRPQPLTVVIEIAAVRASPRTARRLGSRSVLVACRNKNSSSKG